MKWFHKLIGTEDIYNQVSYLQAYITGLRGEIGAVRSQLSVQNRALGKILAKIDPTFLTPEDDPVRKAASDALGDAVIRKLEGEDRYSNPTRGF